MRELLRVLAVLIGIILLLRGLCALRFWVAQWGDYVNEGLERLWVICFAISFVGILLIFRALRHTAGPQMKHATPS